MIGLSCVWVAMGLYFIGVQRQVLYKPLRYSAQQVHKVVGFNILDYRLPSGAQRAFVYPEKQFVKNPPKQVWILLSGRETSVLGSFYSPLWYRLFDEFSGDTDFLLVDYPGFGTNAGYPSERLNREAVQKAYEAWQHRYQLQGIDVASTNIYLLAHSMGTGVAVSVAGELDQLQGVILLSPFESIYQMSRVLLGPWMAWTLRPFLFDRYPTLMRLRTLHEQFPQLPVAVFHGGADTVIPVEHSQNIVHANRWIQYYEYPGFGHEKDAFVNEKLIEVMHAMMQATGLQASATAV